MGIQSTITVSREWAIWRIRKMVSLAESFDFRKIEDISFETDCSVTWFVHHAKDDTYLSLDL